MGSGGVFSSKARKERKTVIKKSKPSSPSSRLVSSAVVDWRKALMLQLAALPSLPHPVMELVFHPSRRWRFDLAWPEQKFAVEVQGGVHTHGRHTRGHGYTKDCEKLAEAVCLGWRVIYVTSEQVKSGQALRWIENILTPTSSPKMGETNADASSVQDSLVAIESLQEKRFDTEEMIASWGNFFLDQGYLWNEMEVRHRDAVKQPKPIQEGQFFYQPDILAQGRSFLMLGLPEFVGVVQDSLDFDLEQCLAFSKYAKQHSLKFWILLHSNHARAFKIFALQHCIEEQIDALFEYAEKKILKVSIWQ